VSYRWTRARPPGPERNGFVLTYAIPAGALPPLCMGVYMGIFNFFIVLTEILAALILIAALLTQWAHLSPASVPANR
jgi:hypothetical protein